MPSKPAKAPEPIRLPCPISHQSPILIATCAENQVRRDAGEVVSCQGRECRKYLVGLQDAPDLDAIIRTLVLIEKRARAGEPAPPFNSFDKHHSAARPPAQEAKAPPPSPTPASASKPPKEPRKKPGKRRKATRKRRVKFDRPLPSGANVTRSGRVWLKTMEVNPCPRCPSGWKAVVSGVCGECRHKHLSSVSEESSPLPGAVSPQVSAALRRLGEALGGLASALEAFHG
jgi:hypothetical protein